MRAKTMQNHFRFVYTLESCDKTHCLLILLSLRRITKEQSGMVLRPPSLDK